MTKGAQREVQTPWRGEFAEGTFAERLEILCFGIVMAASLAFSQTGLLAVRPPIGVSFYMIGLLAPMAMVAMFLGVKGSLVMGIACGAILELHAAVQPLDVFESVVMGSASASVIFGLAGLLLGTLLAIAMRVSERGWLRTLRIAGACFVTSVLFSWTLAIDTFFRVIAEESELLGTVEELGSANLAGLGNRILSLGNPAYQAVANFALMFAVCFLIDLIVEKMGFDRDKRRLSVTFNARLLLVVFSSFLVVMAIGFVTVTEHGKRDAEQEMIGECEYLEVLRVRQEERGVLFSQLTATSDANSSEEERAAFRRYFSSEGLLEGYEESVDGVVIIAYGSDENARVVACDDPAIEAGNTLADEFDWETLEAIFAALETGKLQTTMYEGYKIESGERFSPAEIGYLMAMSSEDSAIDETDAQAENPGGYLYVIMKPARMVFAGRNDVVTWVGQTAFVLVVTMYLLVARLLGQTVIVPVKRMGEELDEICQGKLDTVVDARGSIEFVGLSAGINSTVDALKEWIAEAERRNEQELATARSIQRSALPSVLLPFPGIHEFSLYASMEAAREVGGDFYDFFLVGEDTVAFLVADVSGKGIPGALFMMEAKSELSNFLSAGIDLVDAVSYANARLCEGNDAGMFVTAWVAKLNYATGVLTYVNAGHNPPLLRHEGKWTWLKELSGLFMGSFETARYKSFEMTLSPGDELLLYTDGVNEAFDVHERRYGNERLEAFLEAHADLGAQEIVEGLKADVAQWSEGAQQSDDITIFSLEYHGA